MKSDNELIAEFMGFKYYADYGHHRDVYYEEAVIDPADPDFVQSPHWNESWDWLMPVVEKISNQRSGKFLSPCSRLQSDIAYHLQDLPPKIENVYKAVAEFIKWYNSQSQSK